MPTPPKNVVVSKKELGKRLRTLRQERRITQVELAKMLGVQQTNISAVERGVRGLTIHQAVKLAQALRVSTDEILLGKRADRENKNGLLDRRFVRRLQRIGRLSQRDKQALLRNLDNFLRGAGVD
jgi:transcriptional regulator with XRE-family HTH domain